MNPWVILGFVLAVGAAAGGGYYKGNSAGRAEVQQAWDKEKAEQYAKGQEAARAREQEMQAAADKLRREKDAEIKNINARATALSNSLRDRQERPAKDGSVSGASSTRPAACSGKELYREDGEFLVRIAREADELRAALDQCVKQYNAARQTVK
jgi:glutamate-1-semialdehyde aminotransferase